MNLNIRRAAPSDARIIAELLSNIDDYPQWKAMGTDALEATARKSLEHSFRTDDMGCRVG